MEDLVLLVYIILYIILCFVVFIQVWFGYLGKFLQCFGEEKDGLVKCVVLFFDGEWVVVGYYEGFVKMYEVFLGEVKNGRVYRYM